MTDYTVNLDEGTMEVTSHVCLRDQVRELIEQRSHNRESICTILGINRRHLSTLFAQLRLQGSYPVTTDEKVDGILYFTTQMEWLNMQAAQKAARVTAAAAKSPANSADKLAARLALIERQIDGINERRKSDEAFSTSQECNLTLKKLRADRALVVYRLRAATANN